MSDEQNHDQTDIKASEIWWKLLLFGVGIGLVGLDGVVGIIGKPASGSFSQVLASIVMLVGFLIASLSLIAGFVRFLKWAWKD